MMTVFLAVSGGLLAGCGSSGGSAGAVEEGFTQYLDSQGLGSELEVMGGGCSDADFKQDGLDLWKCVVYRGNDAETWDVAYDGEMVVDASRAGGE